jgi:hypothetical protein
MWALTNVMKKLTVPKGKCQGFSTAARNEDKSNPKRKIKRLRKKTNLF